MNSNWSLIYTCNKNYEAEMLKEILADHGIESFLINKQDSSYLIGDIEIYTRPDDVIRAKHIIEKIEN